MSVFSKLSKKLAQTPQTEEAAAPAVEEFVPPETDDPALPPDVPSEIGEAPVYDEDGYDRAGLHRNVSQPIDPSLPLAEDIKKYRRKDSYYEYGLAVFANYPELKSNFEANRESVAELLADLFLIDEAQMLRLWEWLLSTFELTLSSPPNAYRLAGDILKTLRARGIAPAQLVPLLKKTPSLASALFEKPSYIESGHALLLAECLIEKDFELFNAWMDLLLKNPHTGKEYNMAFEKFLKDLLAAIPKTDMTRETADILTGLIKKSPKNMMRKVLFKMLDEHIEYLVREEERKKDEEERRVLLEKQQQKLAEEKLAMQKEVNARQKLRKSIEQFNDLKAVCISERKNDPLWEGGRFADFQQLAGTTIALQNHPEIPNELLPGDRLNLIRDQYDLADPLSIYVSDGRGTKIGHISHQSNTLLALLMDSGQKIFGRLYSIGQDAETLQICVEIFLEE